MITVFDVTGYEDLVSPNAAINTDLNFYNNKTAFRVNGPNKVYRVDRNLYDCTDRDYLIESRVLPGNSSYLSTSYINQYFNYNPIKFSLKDSVNETHAVDYATTYDLLLNYYHLNFVFYCNKIINSYFPLKNKRKSPKKLQKNTNSTQ